MRWLRSGQRAPQPQPEPEAVPLSPEQARQVADAMTDIRMNGRPKGAFAKMAGQHFMSEGHEWPLVILDDATETATVPASVMGLFALVAEWDSLLMDNEYLQLRGLVNSMVPMGLIGQRNVMNLAQEHAEGCHCDEEEEEVA